MSQPVAIPTVQAGTARIRRVAGSYAAYVAELAGQANQPVSVTLSGKQVTVTLLSRTRKGQPSRWSTAVLAFAKRLAA